MTIDYTLKPGRERVSRQKYKDYKIVISIITPSWNSDNNIFQLANCILNQTYPYYEWLIVDDGSTKKESLENYKKLEKLDPRIKVLHKKNEGLSLTRDYGVAHSSKTSKYVVFIDDDDLLEPTFLECAYFSMCANKEASWCYGDVINFGGFESTWNKRFSSDTLKYENFLVSQAMVKKEAYLDVDGFKLEGNGYYEDWVFWLKLLAKKHFPIHMSYYVFWYRRKNNSGQLKLANSNHKRNMKQIAEYASKIKETVVPIEFPRENYNWDRIPTKIEDVIVPNYQKDERKTILVMVPWMMLGGADKFNLDLFRLIDKTKYRIILLSTQPTEYVWRQQFEEVCDELFDLSTFLDRKDWPSFISYLIESRKVDLIFNTNSQFGYSVLPFLRASYPDIPIMDYIHMEEWYNRNGGYSRDSAAMGSILSKTLFCNQNSERILVDYFKRDKKSVGTVYIGVDSDKFDPKKYNREELMKKYKIPNDKVIVSFISRIDLQKRPFLLMEIIKNLKDYKDIYFVVVGDGPLLKDIKSVANKYHLNNVAFLGKTDHPDEIYAISDMNLNCSIKEGLALTSYESLSMGIPVISANVGGQKELIDEKVGVIVPCLQKEEEIRNFDYTQEEIDSYVKAILKVKKDLNKYKKECRKRILNHFSLNNMIQNMESNFEQVIESYKPDNSLVAHKDITLELINFFLLQDKNQYEWLVREYNKAIYGNDVHATSSGYKKHLWKVYHFAEKFHLANEAELVYYIGSNIIKECIHLLKSFIMLPVWIIKFIYKLFTLEFMRIKRFLKRKLFKKNYYKM